MRIRRLRWLLPLLLVSSGLAAEVRSGYFTTSDGVRLHYLEAGKGPAIVFEPGWTMAAEIWRPQIEYFSRSFHVVALDPRSQGESDKPDHGNYLERRAQDIQELVAHLHLAPAVLVGWSLGVWELLSYVEQFGTGDMRGLVLVDGALWDKADAGFYVRMLRYIKRVEAGDRAKFTDGFVRSMYKKPQPEAYLQGVARTALQTPSTTAFALLASSLDREDWTPLLLKVDKPLLVTVAAGRQADADRLRTQVAGAQTEVFEDAGHALFVDDAERFNRLLERFIAGLPSK